MTYHIPVDHVIKIQKRMSDIRRQVDSGTNFNLPLFLTSIGELFGTLDTVFCDERTYTSDD